MTTFLLSKRFNDLGEAICGGRAIAETLILSSTPPGRYSSVIEQVLQAGSFDFFGSRMNGSPAKDGGRRTEDGGRRTEDGGQRTEVMKEERRSAIGLVLPLYLRPHSSVLLLPPSSLFRPPSLMCLNKIG
jgi:hypothetical protein